MNEFEQQIRRAFDRMFEEIPVPPPDRALERLKERRMRTRRKIWTGGAAAGAAAALLAIAALPHLPRPAGLVYDAPASQQETQGEAGSAGKKGLPPSPPPASGQNGTSPSAGDFRISGADAGNEKTGAAPGVYAHTAPAGNGRTPGAPDRLQPAAESPDRGGTPAAGPPKNPADDRRRPAGEISAAGFSQPPVAPGDSANKGGAETAGNAPSERPPAKALRWSPYLPQYLPPGFEPVVELASVSADPATGSGGVRWTYSGPGGAVLTIEQQPVRPDTALPYPSATSPYPQEQTSVRGRAAVLQWNQDLLHLIWVEGDTRFDVSTNTDKTTLMQVADGLTPMRPGPVQP